MTNFITLWRRFTLIFWIPAISLPYHRIAGLASIGGVYSSPCAR